MKGNEDLIKTWCMLLGIKKNIFFEFVIWRIVFNFHKKHDSVDVSRYINNGFLKIKKYFSNIDTNFIFYIHPLNTEKIGQALLQEFQDIKIPDKRFLNLSNEDFNLEFVDVFHTSDSNIMANKILEDIVLNHEQKIINKINISSK